MFINGIIFLYSTYCGQFSSVLVDNLQTMSRYKFQLITVQNELMNSDVKNVSSIIIYGTVQPPLYEPR